MRLVSWAWMLAVVGAAGGQTATAPTPPALEEHLSAVQKAERLGWLGFYDQAIQRYRALPPAEARSVGAGVGLAECLRRRGEYAEAVQALETVEPAGRRDPRWRVARGRLAETTGDYAAALEHYRAAMEQGGDHFEARWRLGRLLEALGRIDEAIEVYARFETPAKTLSVQRADQATFTGLGFYRLSVLTEAKYRQYKKWLVRRTRHVLQELFQHAYERTDREYWPARIAAADLLAAKYRPDQASEDYAAALKINHNCAEALRGLAGLALEEFEFEKAERLLRQALGINPRDVSAHAGLAALRLTERRYEAAAEQAEAALAVNPRHIDALSMLAAARWFLGQPDAPGEIARRIQAINPKPARMHFILGEWLSAGRQFALAEGHYRKAIEMAPWEPGPQTALGLMYMQWGRETQAREMLEAAWKLDSFHRGTYNTLNLLDRLDTFSRIETPHFVIRVSPKADDDGRTDAVLGPYFADYLERIYDEVCDDYQTRPADKTIIEVFPSQMAFSVRVTSRPWIATVGACTGRVIAMAAPRPGSGRLGQYDWARVLRHEFTHTVTLAATDNRIAHWFTEACAVSQEQTPRSWEWMQALAGRVRLGELFSVKEINWAFIRPRRPGDRQMAYAQSEWMHEYIVERWGYGKIVELLKAQGAVRSQEAIFRTVLGVGEEQFDRDFAEWAARQVADWGFSVEPVEPMAVLTAKAAASPNDADVRCRLGIACFFAGQLDDAETAASKALEIDPEHTRALSLLSSVLVRRAGDEKDPVKRAGLLRRAEPLLRKLASLDPSNPVAPRHLGRIEMDRENWDEAIRWFQRLQGVCPRDELSYRGLSAIYLKRGQLDKALGPLLALARTNEHEVGLPLKLAEIYEGKGDQRSAAKWLTAAIRIDPYTVSTQERLGGMLMSLGRAGEAAVIYAALRELQPAEKKWADMHQRALRRRETKATDGPG